MPGATAATLTLSSLTTSQAGRYHVRVSNQSGALTSATVTLKGPNPPPTITTQPQEVMEIAGRPFSLTVAASGVGPLTYRWRRNGVSIVGATASTYAVPAASQRDNDTYDAQVVWDGWRGLGVTAGIRNLFDRDPPASAQDQTFQVGYEPRIGDPHGRTYYAGLRYTFR